MSERDILKDATRALKEAAQVESDESMGTRERLLISLENKRRRSRNLTVFGTILVISLCCATSWAAISGRLPELLNVLLSDPQDDTPNNEIVLTEPRQLVTPGQAPRLTPSKTTQNDEENPESEEPSVTKIEKQSSQPAAKSRKQPRKRPRKARPRNPEPPPVVNQPEESEATPPQEQPSDERSEPDNETETTAQRALFDRAHRLHFKARNYRAALPLWNRYLAETPSGDNHLEARYNKAICLFHLKRNKAAIQAFRPFADGAHPGYRQREAARMIEGLERQLNNE